MESLNAGEFDSDADATQTFSQEHSFMGSMDIGPTGKGPQKEQESSVDVSEDSTNGSHGDSPKHGYKEIQIGAACVGLEQNILCALHAGDINSMECLPWNTDGTNTPRSTMIINLESSHCLAYGGDTQKQESPTIIMDPTNNLTQFSLCMGAVDQGTADLCIDSVSSPYREATQELEAPYMIMEPTNSSAQVPECIKSLKQGIAGPTEDSACLTYNEEQGTISCSVENMSTEGFESLELSKNRVDVTLCDLSPPRVEKESLDLDTGDISLLPVESLQLALGSNNNLVLSANDVGSASLNSLQFGMAGADWDIGPVHVKCLELSAVNVASLTLGTVGISVVPMVPPATIGMDPMKTGFMPLGTVEWDTLSADSISTGTAAADSVLVDSITPEGVRECWHPMEERLCALGHALAALDEKLESFAPRLQEADTLLNDVEASLRQHATRICNIIHENAALAQRILQLEERVRVQMNKEES